MEHCKSLAHCKGRVVDLEPEGTFLDGKVMLVKHRCKICGRLWAEVYTDAGIIVDLTGEEVIVIEVRGVTATSGMERLEFVLENLNDLKVSDADVRDREEENNETRDGNNYIGR